MSVYLFVGVTAVLSGLCLGLKEFFTSPESVNYPTQSWHAQLTGWLWASVLIYRGGTILCSVWAGHPRLDDGSVILGSFMTFAHIVSRLVDTLDAKAPARAWARMNQIHSIMRCRRWGWTRTLANSALHLVGISTRPVLEAPDPDRARTAAVMTALLGDQVVAPGDVPEEWRPPG